VGASHASNDDQKEDLAVGASQQVASVVDEPLDTAATGAILEAMALYSVYA